MKKVNMSNGLLSFLKTRLFVEQPLASPGSAKDAVLKSAVVLQVTVVLAILD